MSLLALTSATNTALFSQPGKGQAYIAMRGVSLQPIAQADGKIPTIQGPAPNSQGQMIPWVPVRVAASGTGAGKVFKVGPQPGTLAPLASIPSGVLYVAQRDITFAPSPETFSAQLPQPAPVYAPPPPPPPPPRRGLLALGVSTVALSLAGYLTRRVAKSS